MAILEQRAGTFYIAILIARLTGLYQVEAGDYDFCHTDVYVQLPGPRALWPRVILPLPSILPTIVTPLLPCAGPSLNQLTRERLQPGGRENLVCLNGLFLGSRTQGIYFFLDAAPPDPLGLVDQREYRDRGLSAGTEVYMRGQQLRLWP